LNSFNFVNLFPLCTKAVMIFKCFIGLSQK
jgi:hypothetical protein